MPATGQPRVFWTSATVPTEPKASSKVQGMPVATEPDFSDDVFDVLGVVGTLAGTACPRLDTDLRRDTADDQ